MENSSTSNHWEEQNYLFSGRKTQQCERWGTPIGPNWREDVPMAQAKNEKLEAFLLCKQMSVWNRPRPT